MELLKGRYRNPSLKNEVCFSALNKLPLFLHRLAAGVMFVETLPKNQTGKLLRRELKAQVFKGSFGY